MALVTYNHKPKVVAAASAQVSGEFKAGDKVRIADDIESFHTGLYANSLMLGMQGTVLTLTELSLGGHWKVEENPWVWHPKWLTLAAPEHKHAALMKLAEEKPETKFEYRLPVTVGGVERIWLGPAMVPTITFVEHLEYRVYQEPKPDVVLVRSVRRWSGFPIHCDGQLGKKVEYTFDGETDELKSVKLL